LLLAVDGAHRHALELIAEGRGTLPVAAVARERARLLDPEHVRALAASLQELREEARSPIRRRPLAPPLYSRRVIREVDADLADVVAVLRRSRPAAVVVARAERLLTLASSPLYGEDARQLSEALRRLTR
jgi:hypothetical protein